MSRGFTVVMRPTFFNVNRKDNARRTWLKVQTMLQKIKIDLEKKIYLKYVFKKISIWLLTNCIEREKWRNKGKEVRLAEWLKA